MDYTKLEKFGLTEGESKVYFSLLRLGKSTTGNIVRDSNVSSSKIYEILERLVKKGMVGKILENERIRFEAKDPERFKDFILSEENLIKEKKKELSSLLPALKSIYKKSEVKEGAEILAGYKGLMTWHKEILDEVQKGDTILIISPTAANEQMDAHLLEWHAKRIRQGIKCKILYNEELNEWAKDREKLDLTEVRFLPKNIRSPVALNITKSSVANTIFGNNLITFIIKNSQVAENYRVYFDLLWEQSKK